jgi:hypothetical protein
MNTDLNFSDLTSALGIFWMDREFEETAILALFVPYKMLLLSYNSLCINTKFKRTNTTDKQATEKWPRWQLSSRSMGSLGTLK